MKKTRLITVAVLTFVMFMSLFATSFACEPVRYPQRCQVRHTVRYTVYYRDADTKVQLAPSVSKYAADGSKVTENAIDIENYEVYGEAVKSICVRWCKCNAITFYYTKKADDLTDYTVRYLESGTEQVLAPEKAVKGIAVGTEVSEKAIEIEGYNIVGSDTQTLLLKGKSSKLASKASSETGVVTRASVISAVMEHAGLSKELIGYLDIEKERSEGRDYYEIDIECKHGCEYEYIVDCETESIVQYEWEGKGCNKCRYYYNYYKESINHTSQQEQETATEEETPNVITFYYEKAETKPLTTSYGVKYLDIDTLEPVLDEKTVHDVEIGASITETAIEIEGYKAVEPAEITMIMGEADNTFIFYYKNENTDYIA